MNNQIDFTDQEIMKILMKDARTPFKEIAEQLNVSNSLIHQRVKKLRESGIIEGSEIIINPKKAGFNSCAYTGVVLKEAKMCEQIAKEFEKIPEVVECHYVSGQYALFVKIYAFDNDHMRSVLYEKLHQIEGVSSTDTFMSFKTYFDRNVPV